MITVKTGEPYDEWHVKKLGLEAGLECVRSFEFHPSDYPGYEHRRTIGFVKGFSDDKNGEITKRSSRTYVFSKKE